MAGVPLNPGMRPNNACQYSGGSDVKTIRSIWLVSGSRKTCHSQYSSCGR